jgi:topoisomerase IV subunit A
MTEEKDFAGKGTEQVEQLYQDWFLDYASYVILDRAVPYFEDGLKPVQRRILHTLWEKEDGRFHKIANIIGHTMQYHPHGDASIGDAIVNLGQKELLIETQGNWGNVVTGDRAAAPRYIEGRLTPFAKDVLFNAETTHWVSSYDGRNQEPVTLPVKFPLVLAQGVEGIAVGLSTKILPHNFCELIEACIANLRKKPFQLFPDFPTGGVIDVSEYNDGQRGGRVKVRARIEKQDNKTLIIRDIPFGTTTGSVMDSIVAANNKGKIKVKKIEDNTAAEVEIVIILPPSSDPQTTIDALYAFTDCEVSISPNCCIVVDRKPVFTSASDLLKRCTDHTLHLLEWELKNQIEALQKKWHLTSLEKIFIEKKVYEVIEEATDREDMVAKVQSGLEPYIKHLRREVSRDDILKLCEIPIRRISRFDVKKTNDLLAELDKKIAETQFHLDNLVDYAVQHFKNLLKTYGASHERKTRIANFETVQAVHVAVANQKLYVNRKEGFVGTSLRKEEYLFDVSPYDEIIAFRRDGIFQVFKVEDKVFIGKDIILVEKFVRGDQHRIYNMIYQDGKEGRAYGKRFNAGGITRSKEYDLTRGTKGSKIWFLDSNPNGEAAVVEVVLKPQPRIKLNFEVDFAEIPIKGRSSQGNTITKYLIRSVKLLRKGESTTGPRKMFFDPATGMFQSQRGDCIGEFNSDDKLIVIRRNGKAQLYDIEENLLLGNRIEYLGKYDAEKVFSMVYFDGEKIAYLIKRFTLADIPQRNEFSLVTDHEDSKILLLLDTPEPRCMIEFQGPSGRSVTREVLNLADEGDVRGYRALGNRLTAKKIRKIAPAPDDVLQGDQSVEEALKKADSLEQDLFDV